MPLFVDARIPYFRKNIRKWARTATRNVPWRQTGNPWLILVAEMLLQRTTVRQVAAEWAWIEKEMSSPSACLRHQREIRALASRLGLPRRADYLILIAERLVQELKGQVPLDPEGLLALPGVGRYTANAVACFAGGRRLAIVDANVIRVLGRFFDAPSRKRNNPERDPHMWALATKVLGKTRDPVGWNRALLDFGALVCTARRPRCGICVVRRKCSWASRESESAVQ